MIKTAIIGATGYTGRELIRRLLRHREVEIRHLSAITQKEEPISSIFPCLSSDIIIRSTMKVEEVAECEVVFLCLPHKVSMEYAPSLLDFGNRVIDLSADFRLKDPDVYEEWYGERHSAFILLKESVYGLPELYRQEIKEANLIANPGCYPTSALLGLAPLIKNKLVDLTSIVIDAKSGVSGAGRNPSLLTHFPEVNESCKAYSLFTHRHIPEIEQELSGIAGEKVTVTFVPHLVSMDCGMLSTIYLKLLQETDLIPLYKDFYKGEPFIRIMNEPPVTKDTVSTNLCLIHPKSEGKRAIVLSAIDNLVKGAAGQAIQNMNIMFGFPEEEGLL
ncbi:N-acetyl-gamma-glutamyl-phosphate reductase [bacterium]|nr:N-acetyl-gamma-glutamyl-phosphate reductase [bacterium]MBU2462320.1 N-acetyl-gamma-glutamyl-phosphate reductase [bacterium]